MTRTNCSYCRGETDKSELKRCSGCQYANSFAEPSDHPTLSCLIDTSCIVYVEEDTPIDA